MKNIMTLLGTGYYGEDVLNKTPWINKLSKNQNVFIVSRIDPIIHINKQLTKLLSKEITIQIKNNIKTLKEKTKKFSIIYNSAFMNRNYSEKEIQESQKWLGVSFSYMASFDRSFFDKSNNKDIRNKIILNNYITGLVSFFSHEFIENDISHFVNTLEDEIFSVVAYFVAKKLRISIIGMVSGRFPKKGIMFCDNYEDVILWNTDKHTDMNEIKELYNKNKIVNHENINKRQKNYSIFNIKDKIKGLLYIVNYKKYRNLLIMKLKYEQLIYKKTSLINEIYEHVNKIWRRHIIKIIIKKPENEPFVLFPLHYEDDAQLTFREPLINQYEMIMQISRCLPYGHYLYVKPHPHFIGTDVSFFKMLFLSNIKNVKIINPTYPTYPLINKAKLIITINATTGFEALIFNRKLITLGHDFYCKSKISTRIDDINNMSEIITKLLNSENIEKNSLTTKFIHNVFSNMIWTENIILSNGIYTYGEKDSSKISNVLNIIISKDPDQLNTA
jgi:hypothetical protein